MGGFDELTVHEDVRYGIPALAALNTRLVTFSNGAATVAERLFARAGIGQHFEMLLSVEDVGVWKPVPGAYAYAAQQCDVEPIDLMLVAVHPWDTDGARGLRRTAELRKSDATSHLSGGDLCASGCWFLDGQADAADAADAPYLGDEGGPDGCDDGEESDD